MYPCNTVDIYRRVWVEEQNFVLLLLFYDVNSLSVLSAALYLL